MNYGFSDQEIADALVQRSSNQVRTVYSNNNSTKYGSIKVVMDLIMILVKDPCMQALDIQSDFGLEQQICNGLC
jgi:hypothetical protein